ncbi:MAG TPA: S8 family serine peptidase [Coleofasciculaceae cyanobacterium]
MFSNPDTTSTTSCWLDRPDLLSSSVGLHSAKGELENIVPPSNNLVGSSSAPLTVTAEPGDGFGQALNVGTLDGSRTFEGFVGSNDLNDYYQLTLITPGSLNISLDGLTADANLQLFDSSGVLVGGSVQFGNEAESLNVSDLAAGTYYIQVYQYSGDTNYTLDLSTSLQDQTSPTLASVANSNNTAVPPTVSTNYSPLSTSFSLVDASGDNTTNTVFQGGALRLSYNVQSIASLSNVRLEALKSGSVVSTLGTWSAANLSNTLINLASFSGLTAGDYQFRLVSTTTSAEVFFSELQSIKILTNNRFNGTFAADTLQYSLGAGTGAIFLGRGGTDAIDFSLSNINRSNITSINGLSLTAFNPLSGSTTNQAIYGGTAFDHIRLSDGREIYFQGIESLRFADGTTFALQVRPNDSFFNYQWNLAVSDVPSAWRFTTGASNVLLVSLDTGILTAAGASGGIVDLQTNRLITNYWDDDNFNDYGHGHSAISIMSSTANNNSGVAGINWNSQVYVNDVYGGNKAGVWRVTLQGAIRNAINYARANNMRVVFQGGVQGDVWLNDGGTQAELEQLIQANSDIAVFAMAAGNGGVGGNLSESSYATDSNYLNSVSGVATLQTAHSNVMSVGALQRTATTTVDGLTNAASVNLASYSNRGSNLTLVAASDSPAMDKYGNMNIFTGTSAANPNLAGIASLVWSVNPSLTGGQIRQVLAETAMDLGTVGRDNTYGSGLVNADAAVRRAVALLRNPEVANLSSGSSLLV